MRGAAVRPPLRNARDHAARRSNGALLFDALIR